ncbi:MAG: ABC transporter ATP-binding protein [Spirochaetaceae bacterium]|jgi:peptide/nickel transport system ATP-binding protein|nr:ABC transporter ATP-binding protein [Spirochaetaceae bacterium]
MTPLLCVKDLAVDIVRGKDVFPAVKGISFNIDEGEILGIVGESGCGKTLTALSIPGLLPGAARMSAGDVVFRGRGLSGLSGRELCRIRGKDISMIFQEPLLSLNPLLRIGRQREEPLLLHGERDRRANRARVLDIMARLNLSDPARLVRAYPHELSGGMCQRVMIAAAMICGPSLLIADEPTTALDAVTQAQIIELIRDFNERHGTAVLFISHDLSVIRRLCSRVLVMYAGKIVEAGKVEDVFKRPLHEYTRGLAASIPGREMKGRALANIPGKVPSIEEQLPGCPFAPRCLKAREQCRKAFPETASFGGGQSVHCFMAASSAAAYRGARA